MGTRLNRYYNDPNIGAAFQNLSSIFAPQAPADILAYAQAAKVQRETQGLDTLYGLDPAADPNAYDRAAIAAGRYSPTQSYKALGMGDATDRRGQDVAAGASRYGSDRGYAASTENNVRDNKTNLAKTVFGNLGQGDTRPDITAEWAGALGVPTLGATAGTPKPLSQDEVEAQLLTDAIGKGMVGPQDAATAMKSDIPVEQIVSAVSGQPEIVNRADAVGQKPYATPGSLPAKVLKTYTIRDAAGNVIRNGSAVFDPGSGTMTDEATGQRLPEGTTIGDIQDTQAGMTTTTNSNVQNQGLASVDAIKTIDRLTSLISLHPGSQGLAGQLRGTVQDVIATMGDVGQQFGGEVEAMQRAVAADPSLRAVMGDDVFDPSIPAIEMQANILAWQVAKVMAGGDRVSNQQLIEAKNQVGASGIFAPNTSNTPARLAELRQHMIDMADTREGIQASPIQRQIDALRTPPGTPPAAAPLNTPTATGPNGEKLKLVNGQWVPQ
jgi:hypothetical protein